MGEPTKIFHNLKEAYDCLAYWKKVLFLEHWIISIKLCEDDDEDLIEDGEGGKALFGKNMFVMENNSCLIKIRKYSIEEEDSIVKYSDELTLVHELLHLKYNWTAKRTDSIEYIYYETLEHQLIEQMAKSLIMAKYNLTFDWFINFKLFDDESEEVKRG
jgi:hypothetical protein